MTALESTLNKINTTFSILSISRRGSLSYRNQSIDLHCKSLNWFLYDRDLGHKRVNLGLMLLTLGIYLFAMREQKTTSSKDIN